jgi:hypothetical protein
VALSTMPVPRASNNTIHNGSPARFSSSPPETADDTAPPKMPQKPSSLPCEASPEALICSRVNPAAVSRESTMPGLISLAWEPLGNTSRANLRSACKFWPEAGCKSSLPASAREPGWASPATLTPRIMITTPGMLRGESKAACSACTPPLGCKVAFNSGLLPGAGVISWGKRVIRKRGSLCPAGYPSSMGISLTGMASPADPATGIASTMAIKKNKANALRKYLAVMKLHNVKSVRGFNRNC